MKFALKANRLVYRLKILEIVYSDVMGPISRESIARNRFILNFVDDYSRKIFVVPIKRKSDVLDEFMVFFYSPIMVPSIQIKSLRI